MFPKAHSALLGAALLLLTTTGIAAPDVIITNAKVTQFQGGDAAAIAIEEGLISAVSMDSESLLDQASSSTLVIDAGGRRLIPGLNDSHLHVVRGGRFFNLETRWEGLTSLKEGLDRIEGQAARTPEGQWVRVVGGWSPYQFDEKRMPTVDELNAAAPDTPVFVLFLYSGGLLNQAAMRALGIDRESVAPEGSRFERDQDGNPTGLLIADPNPLILYRTIAALPQLNEAEQLNSSLQFFHELMGFGITSAIDAGGGGHQFPTNYGSSLALAKRGELPIRIANYLFPQKPKQELNQFAVWMSDHRQNENLDTNTSGGFVIEGGGELLTWSASDYENFTSDRPPLKPEAEAEIEQVIRLHVLMGWPFRIHATYDESIDRLLSVLERVDRDQPLSKVRWAFDHAETVLEKNLQRIKALGGGIAVQGRMAFAGEYFLERYGQGQTRKSPPIKRMLELGIPVGLGTDGTRVSSFNPWATYYWAVTGRSVGGTQLLGKEQTLDRLTALRLFTKGSAWFSGEEAVKGAIAVGQYADVALLDRDVLTVTAEALQGTRSVLTIVNGEVRHGSGPFSTLAPNPPAAIPDWSPVNFD